MLLMQGVGSRVHCESDFDELPRWLCGILSRKRIASLE